MKGWHNLLGSVAIFVVIMAYWVWGESFQDSVFALLTIIAIGVWDG